MLMLSKQEYRSQIQALATTDTPNSLEFVMRLVMIGLPVLVGFWTFGLVTPVAWYFIYFSGLLIQYQLVLRVKARPKRAAFWRLVFLNLTLAFVYMSLPMMLWISDVTIFRVAAVALSVGAMLHSLAHRARLPYFALGDAAANCAFLVVVAWNLSLHQPNLAGILVVILMISSMGIYYVTALLNIFRVRASLRDATRRSAEALKMQAIGQLTGGVAHDFNNILTVVMGNLELYGEVNSRVEKDQLAQDAYSAAFRASVLTGQLLAFSRQATLLPETVELRSFVETFWGMAKRIMPDEIEFRIEVPGNLPCVQADRNQFEAAVLNLVINARDAMPNGGQIRISADVLDIAASRGLTVGYGLPVGRYLRVQVSDTGQGIAQGLKTRVFDPFFTTKDVGQGSGLGLSMAKGFASQSGGTLFLESEENVGTVVTLILPSAGATELAPIIQ